MTMTLPEALEILRANEAMLRERGVLHAAVFGSIARGDARADSDIDVLVDLDPEKRIGLFGYAGLCEDIKDLFPIATDVVNANALKKHFRESILEDRVYAF